MSTYQWTKKGVPHTGWSRVKRVQLESASHTCEMCDKPYLKRYDVLRHDNFGSELKVGTECSDLMRTPFKNGFKWPTDRFLMILQLDESSPWVIANSKQMDFIHEKFETKEDAEKYVIENNLY